MSQSSCAAVESSATFSRHRYRSRTFHPAVRSSAPRRHPAASERKPSDMAAHFLFFFDFDETLIAENSDNSVIRAAPFQELPPSLSRMNHPGYFLEHTQNIMTFLNKCGITEDTLSTALQQVPPSPGVSALLDFLSARGDFECVVVSDANSYFIETWLRHIGVHKLFTKVLTNPADFDAHGRLVLHPFHTHSCPKCPVNMCKQTILRDYTSKREKERGKPFQKIFYIGDGENDICPTLALGQNDVVFPRRGFPMHRFIQDLQKTQPGMYKPSVVPWERGEDVMDFLKKVLQEQ
ncbi:probable phosphatase phospho1 isoform X1 [Silurus meridionalis]|uniref:Phosphatase phospho1 n=2 Tax=Silurus meridionalis TaxID=175797 RepID=A0A8T0BHA2_SILME|nr:probable phosphatase phospho1 isoform X1 [Silurus meridionalis]KAF7704896.1 hypothetical protein HF521_020182 [Silurus meridionalis]